MNNYGFKFILSGILIVAILSTIFIKTQTSHHQQHDQVFEAFEAYQQAHSRLDQNVLMSRYNILAHYDPLVDASTDIIKIINTLQGKEIDIFQQGYEDIDQALVSLRANIEQKIALLEQFKSRNAILKNSLRYLPVAINHFVDALPPGSHNSDHRTLLTDLLGAILSYNITADKSFRDKVTTTIEIIKRRKGEFAEQDIPELNHILIHTSTILQEKAFVDTLVGELIFKHDTESLNKVFNAYKRYNADRNADAEVFRTLLYLIAIILLAYVGYAVIQLRNNSLRLNRAYADLHYQKFAMDQHSIVSTTDAAGKITYANQRFVDISEFTLDELIGQSHSIINSGHQSESFFADMWKTIGQGLVWHGELKNKKKNGDYYWVNSTIVPFMDENNNPYQYIAIRTDITKQKSTEEALLREKELAEITLHSISDGVITTNDQGLITYINPMAASLIGCEEQNSMGKHIDGVLNIIDESNHKRVSGLIQPCLVAQAKVRQDNIALIQNEGLKRSIEIAATPLFDNQRRVLGAVIVLHDVTETRTLTQQMTYLASHDPLTGLVNRREFKNRLSSMLDSARKHNHEHALCYIDLDQFKIINDTCGHVAGDELLKQLANLLADTIRSRDTLARLGGDEFGLLLGECPPDRALVIAQNICNTVKGFRFVWDKMTFEIGASIGVVQINSASESPTEILSLADAACYTAKDNGRNRVHLYQEDDAELQQRYGEMQWIPRLSKALAEDRFTLYCQPIRTLNSQQQGEHFEVLIRLRAENGDLVPPGAFIPAAERYGMMPTIDRWVIKQTFSIYSHYYHQLPEAINDTCAINLSGPSLNETDFLAFIMEQLETYELPAHIFCFEVTETAAISNLTTAVGFIQQLKDKGCQFSLDDFGSGVSSFSYLKKLPVDYLKIDGNFIVDMVDDPIDRAMVKSINEVGHLMGLKTIAEYIETEELEQLAQEIGIDYGQGYSIGKARPLDEYLAQRFNIKALHRIG